MSPSKSREAIAGECCDNPIPLSTPRFPCRQPHIGLSTPHYQSQLATNLYGFVDGVMGLSGLVWVVNSALGCRWVLGVVDTPIGSSRVIWVVASTHGLSGGVDTPVGTPPWGVDIPPWASLGTGVLGVLENVRACWACSMDVLSTPTGRAKQVLAGVLGVLYGRAGGRAGVLGVLMGACWACWEVLAGRAGRAGVSREGFPKLRGVFG
jgi:hypothetical protein